MAAGNLTPRTAFQVKFKCNRLFLASKSDTGFNKPWCELSGMNASTLIVLLQTGLKVSCTTDVMMFARFTSQNVYVTELFHSGPAKP